MSVTQLEERLYVERAVESVAKVIEAHGDAGEQGRNQPQAVIDAMREAGLLRLWTPREYGGDEVRLATFMSAVERLSVADAAAGWTFANLAAGATLAAFLPTEGAEEVYSLGPDVALPGSVAPSGQAVPASGGYRVSGRWPLASGCDYGDWLGAVCIVSEDGVPRLGPTGAPDLKVLFLRKEDCRIEDTWHSLGLRGTGSSHFHVDEAFVPEGRSFSLFSTPPQVQGQMYRIGVMGLFSMALTSVLLGTARAAIDAFVELAKDKTPTLSQTGLATRPTIHAQVARAEALLASARAFLYECAAELENCVATAAVVEDAVEVRCRLACVNAGENSLRVVDMMFALSGSSGVYAGSRLERCLRDAHTASQHLAVSQVWWEKTGQYYFGLGLGMP